MFSPFLPYVDFWFTHVPNYRLYRRLGEHWETFRRLHIVHKCPRHYFNGFQSLQSYTHRRNKEEHEIKNHKKHERPTPFRLFTWIKLYFPSILSSFTQTQPISVWFKFKVPIHTSLLPPPEKTQSVNEVTINYAS